MDALEEMVGQTMVAFLVAAGVFHVGASLVLLATTKRLPPGTRAGLLAGCLLVPLIGPVLAVFTAWSAAQRSQRRHETRAAVQAGR
jgi:hypothetical protein